MHAHNLPIWLVIIAMLAGCGAENGDSTFSREQPQKSSAQMPVREWVAVDRLNRRTCPSEDCGIVGQLFYREAVEIRERRGAWVRITQPYDASCTNGSSQFVDEGNNLCSEENGIKNGQFSEWVSAQYLSEKRPSDPAEGATGYSELVALSDDFRRYEQEFVLAAQKLIEDGTCSESDFKEMGGWVKSVSNYDSKPVYFMYCGGMTRSNRIYLDVSNGRTFR